MIKFNTPRDYSFIVGLLLFLMGFLGFAFRDSFAVPDKYLLLSLILGFWGLVVAAANKKI
jgi:hypothetical protein